MKPLAPVTNKFKFILSYTRIGRKDSDYSVETARKGLFFYFFKPQQTQRPTDQRPLPNPPHVGRAYLTDGNRQKTVECFTLDGLPQPLQREGSANSRRPLPNPPHVGRAYLTDRNRQKKAECFTFHMKLHYLPLSLLTSHSTLLYVFLGRLRPLCLYPDNKEICPYVFMSKNTQSEKTCPYVLRTSCLYVLKTKAVLLPCNRGSFVLQSWPFGNVKAGLWLSTLLPFCLSCSPLL